MSLAHSVGSIFTIFIMMAVGFALTKARWFDESTSKLFAKLAIKVALPCYMVYSLTETFTKTQLASLSKYFLVPIASMLSCYVLGVIVSYVIKVDRKRRGAFRTMFFVSNTMFIGLPVNLALFGEESVPYVLLYYIINTTFYWTIGVYEISRDNLENGAAKLFSAKTLKNLLNPALMGFSVSIILLMLDVRLPEFLLASCKYIGNLTTPLAMFFTGIVLSEMDISKLRPSADITFLIVARALICPMMVIALNRLFRIAHMMGLVFVVQAAMPVISSTGILAKEYGSDYEFATTAVMATTLASLIVIPVYMAFIA
jgi:predicted permease